MVQFSTRTLLKSVILAGILPALAACGTKLAGTYTNANGLAMVELRSGGKATTSMMGESRECTYALNDQTIHLNCSGDKSDFRLNEDGSLTGPGFIGVLTKSKK
jgi:hypothetical protein